MMGLPSYDEGRKSKNLHDFKERTCPDCKGKASVRNPTGRCDHLHYPEYKNQEEEKMNQEDFYKKHPSLKGKLRVPEDPWCIMEYAEEEKYATKLKCDSEDIRFVACSVIDATQTDNAIIRKLFENIKDGDICADAARMAKTSWFQNRQDGLDITIDEVECMLFGLLDHVGEFLFSERVVPHMVCVGESYKLAVEILPGYAKSVVLQSEGKTNVEHHVKEIQDALHVLQTEECQFCKCLVDPCEKQSREYFCSRQEDRK